MAQIDEQSLQLNFQLMSLPYILQIVLHDLRTNLEERVLNFKMKPIPPELGSFYADPQRVYQVFEYVIGNAIKYTPDGGSITITQHVDASGNTSWVCSLSATGLGAGVKCPS